MDETFRVFNRVLSVAGISIFAKPNWNSRGWLIFQSFNFLLGILTFVFTSIFVILNLSDLLVCIQGGCVWTTGVIMFISLGICLFFKKDFESFVDEMAFSDRALDIPLVQTVVLLNAESGKLGELKDLVLNSQARVLKLTKALLKTYVASVWLCATMYICGPIYGMIVRKEDNLRLLVETLGPWVPEECQLLKAMTRFVKAASILITHPNGFHQPYLYFPCKNISFDMWFPWSLDNFNVYIGSFIFHAYAGYLCCIAYPGLQSMIILLVFQVIRQLQIITFILTYLDDLVLEVVGNRKNKWQSVCTTVLSQCVQHYVRTKRFANRLNVICQPFYLALILVATMLVCMCSVKIAVSNKLALDTIKYYVHEFCFILVVLMFCSLGQQLKNQCEKLEMAVTEKWYIFNKEHEINLLIFNMAISQNMPIYVFGTITLSLPTFTWFIRTGMSFFTLLMSFLEA